jgi:hypothetical protein
MQSAVEKIAGTVSREHPASPIRAVRAWSQTKNQDARGGIAKPGDGAPPIILVTVHAALFAGHALAPLHQTRASHTARNFGGE